MTGSDLPMRVLVVTGHSDRFHSDLPQTMALVGLKHAGVEIEVMCPDTAPTRQLMVDAGIRVSHLVIANRFDFAARRALRDRLAGGGYDIVHAFNAHALQNVLPAARGSGTGVLVYRGTVGNVSVFDPMAWATYLHPRLDGIACVCDAAREFFDTQLHLPWWRFPVGKAVTIAKGHDLDWYQEPPVARAELGVPDDAFLVACLVNERPRKGLSYLVDALPAMRCEGSPVHLLLIGSVHVKKTLASIAASPARDRIHLVGFRSDAAQVQAACDVCVLPTLKREGLPRAVIEGMAYGVTPVVTSAGGSKELIVDGESGLVIEPASAAAISGAVNFLAADPGRNRAMGQAARHRISSHFSVKATVEKTLALYRELIADGRPGGRSAARAGSVG